ncbi:putative membrane protein, partial [Vibrio parahaemolyticus V-223/04]
IVSYASHIGCVLVRSRQREKLGC